VSKTKTRYVVRDRVARIEHKVARQWISGTGADAKFEDGTIGWYVVFASCPASMYLGEDQPDLKTGDRVRLTLERE
jgi:hypothetical protein